MNDLMDLTSDQIRRVYSGKPGCGCGCRGKYFTDPKNIKRVLKAMKQLINNSKQVGVKDGIAFVETDSRYYWAYLK